MNDNYRTRFLMTKVVIDKPKQMFYIYKHEQKQNTCSVGG